MVGVKSAPHFCPTNFRLLSNCACNANFQPSWFMIRSHENHCDQWRLLKLQNYADESYLHVLNLRLDQSGESERQRDHITKKFNLTDRKHAFDRLHAPPRTPFHIYSWLTRTYRLSLEQQRFTRHLLIPTVPPLSLLRSTPTSSDSNTATSSFSVTQLPFI